MRRFSIGRQLLKTIPLMKILTNRHFVRPVKTDIGKTSRIDVTSVITENSNKERRTRRYCTPLHEITLSVVSSGIDENDCPAADVGIGINTLAGDVRINQVRVDLDGIDEVLSVYGNTMVHVAAGGNEYTIHVLDDMCDGILMHDGRLAIDISLSSNWNFFGEYRLPLRVARRARKD
jgi:hypothetical protein